MLIVWGAALLATKLAAVLVGVGECVTFIICHW